MAQAPGYDANEANRVLVDLQRNRAVTDTYEPGSTFKLVTVTGVLSEGLVKPDDEVHAAVLDPGRRPHRPRRRAARDRDVDASSQILKHSSNVGAITLAEKLGEAA